MVTSTFAAVDPWRWVPRPTVWFLVLSLAALYWYAIRRIGPRAARPGETVVTRGQLAWFGAAMVTLWLASDWPLHDVGENYLYSAHMAQHLLLTLVLPPMALLATPTWLARLVVGSGRAYTAVRWVAKPLVATVLFNAVVVFQHWPAVVSASVSNGIVHYAVHTLVVASSVVMWLPVAGPLPELRPPLPVQLAYLFAQSIIPTVPAGWLTFAESTVYKAYDTPFRLWSLTAAEDQQLAGMLMKVVGGFYLWGVIFVLFIRFATKHVADDRASGATLDRRAPAQPRPSSTEDSAGPEDARRLETTTAPSARRASL